MTRHDFLLRGMILGAALALTGCKSEGDRFADDYERAEKDPALTGKDMCEAAAQAAKAYQREHDLVKASDWRHKATMTCLTAGVVRP